MSLPARRATRCCCSESLGCCLRRVRCFCVLCAFDVMPVEVIVPALLGLGLSLSLIGWLAGWSGLFADLAL